MLDDNENGHENLVLFFLLQNLGDVLLAAEFLVLTLSILNDSETISAG